MFFKNIYLLKTKYNNMFKKITSLFGKDISKILDTAPPSQKDAIEMIEHLLRDDRTTVYRGYITSFVIENVANKINITVNNDRVRIFNEMGGITILDVQLSTEIEHHVHKILKQHIESLFDFKMNKLNSKVHQSMRKTQTLVVGKKPNVTETNVLTANGIDGRMETIGA